MHKQLQVISGLTDLSANAGPDGAGDHARASGTFLTGVRIKKTAGSDIRAGVSIDQVVANQIGHLTRFSSLELTCDAVRKSGDCDSGYACAYEYNLAWRSHNQPLSPEHNPRFVFERLFGAGGPRERVANLKRRQAEQHSILDFVLEDARSVNDKLDGRDKQKLDQYLTSVREIEQRIENSSRLPVKNPDRRCAHRHSGQLRGTRGADVRHAGARVRDGLHARGDAADLARRQQPQLRRHRHRLRPPRPHAPQEQPRDHREGEADRPLVRAAVRRASSRSCENTEDVDGKSLLDHSMILYGSGNADGNRHTHENLPIVLAGGGGGALKPGRFVKTPGVPITNLFLTHG